MSTAAIISLLLLLVVVVLLALANRRAQAENEASGLELTAYEEIFDRSNDALLVLDLANGQIRRANARAAELVGRSLPELRTLTVFDLHIPADLDRSARRMADAWASKGGVFEDIPFRRKDGTLVPVECSVRVTTYRGVPAIILQARDIRERLRLQAEVAEKTALVEQRNLEHLSSLRYASMIQRGMLPARAQIRGAFRDAFVMERPRDIVSGDFYWAAQAAGRTLVAVADCTGHGVPGALLSMTGIGLLRQLVDRGVLHPARMLDELRVELLRALVHHEGSDRLRDGMNIALISYDPVAGEVAFSGALHSLYILRNDATAVEEVKGDRVPITLDGGGPDPYRSHLVPVTMGDRLFMTSDGFADQFGGPMGKRFKSAALRALIRSTGDRPLAAQGTALEAAFGAWKGDHEQVDDVLLVGLQV